MASPRRLTPTVADGPCRTPEPVYLLTRKGAVPTCDLGLRKLLPTAWTTR